MHRVVLAGGPTLVRDAYAHVIAAAPAFTLQAHTATLTQALNGLHPTACDLLLIDAHELARAPLAPVKALSHAALHTRVAVHGAVPSAELPLLAEAGVTGVLGPFLEPHEFLTALDAVCRGAMVISPAPLRAPAGPPAPGVLTSLTQREREVLTLLATQPDNTAIAQALGLSLNTVKTHVNRIMHKLTVANRSQLVALAYETGLVVPGLRAASGAPLE
ncbi:MULTISPECIES: response regulator transcription factor [unclassified Streptomyces]|uniref:response regulator transcription factor n=1 Tax=unclassified Streptomyces TaxID=2593676 RepID=UPI00093F816D|nr:response regulator transcription factor [Streptomyces sp. CB02058]OKI85877.1 LuxR family transcriptional regulator [Streptomyces sp. CB02058]